jgi:hypothetical protein
MGIRHNSLLALDLFPAPGLGLVGLDLVLDFKDSINSLRNWKRLQKQQLVENSAMKGIENHGQK